MNLKKFQKHLKAGKEVEFYWRRGEKNPNQNRRGMKYKFALKKKNDEVIANYQNLEQYFSHWLLGGGQGLQLNDGCQVGYSEINQRGTSDKLTGTKLLLL